jgi:purine-cytosine permease-like protein
VTSTATPEAQPQAPAGLTITETDDPRVVEEAASSDYSLHVVPRTWRLGRLALAMAWSSLLTAMFWIVFAATVALAVGTRDALIGIALSVIAYGAINYVLSVAAARTGLTVALISRSMFGYFGASLATAVFAAGAIYFAIFEASVLAVAFQVHFGGSLNTWYLVMAGVSVPIVLGGIRVWLDKLNGFLLPLFAGGLIAAVIWAVAEFGYDGSWASYEPESTAGIAGPGWWFAFTAYMGVWLSMFYTFDFARLGKVEEARSNGFWLFGPPYWLLTLLVNGVVGIFLAQAIPTEGGVSEASVVVGIVQMMGWAGLIFVLATQIKINSANVYLASTNAQSFFSRALRITLPRSIWTVAIGVVMYVVMRTDVFSFILKALQYQGAVVVGWVAIALVQLGYFRRRGQDETAWEFRPGRVPGINPGGLTAWVVGSAVGVYLIAHGAPTGVTWALPATFALSGGLYAVALALARPAWFVTTRPNDPRLEVPDPWQQRILCGSCDRSYVAVEIDREPDGEHRPICSQCATGYGFHRAAQQEARAVAG